MAVSDDAKLITAAILTLATVLENSEEQGTTRSAASESARTKVIETFRTIYAIQEDRQ